MCDYSSWMRGFGLGLGGVLYFTSSDARTVMGFYFTFYNDISMFILLNVICNSSACNVLFYGLLSLLHESSLAPAPPAECFFPHASSLMERALSCCSFCSLHGQMQKYVGDNDAVFCKHSIITLFVCVSCCLLVFLFLSSSS